jgi:HEAT repeat protein
MEGVASPAALNVLKEAVKDADPAVRRMGGAALAKVVESRELNEATRKDVVETLRKALDAQKKDKLFCGPIVVSLSTLIGNKDLSEDLQSAIIRTVGSGIDSVLVARQRTDILTTLKKLGPAAKDAADGVGRIVMNAPDNATLKLALEVLEAIGPRAVKALVAVVKNAQTDVTIRQIAASTALKIGPEGPEAVPDLIDILQKEKTPELRKFAADSLAKIGPDAKDAVPALVKAVKDMDETVKDSAAKALGKIGKTAVPSLIKALESKDEQERLTAAEALGLIGPDAAAAAEVLNKLAADDASNNVRQKATEALDKIGKSPVPTLIAKLKDPDATKRTSAVEALGGLGPKAKEAVVALRAALMQEKEAAIRAKIVIALRDIGTEAARGALPELINALKDADLEVRKQAVATITGYGPDAEAAVPLLSEMLKDKDEGLRKDASDCLAKIGRSAVPALIEALKDKDLAMRRQAAADAFISLGVKGKAAVPALIDALKDTDVGVRRTVCLAIKEMGAEAKDCAVELSILLIQDSDKEVRENSLHALLNITADTAIVMSALKGALRDKDDQVRALASDAFAKYGILAVPPLVALLKDKVKNTKIAAIETLGKIGKPAKDAIAPLTALRKDTDDNIRQAAAEALKKIDE